MDLLLKLSQRGAVRTLPMHDPRAKQVSVEEGV